MCGILVTKALTRRPFCTTMCLFKYKNQKKKKPWRPYIRPQKNRNVIWGALISGSLVFALALVGTSAITQVFERTTEDVSAAAFVVTSTADTDDGVCDADCTLRDAITASNASAGADTITLPAGTFVSSVALTVAADEPLSITGAGQGTTTIALTSASITLPGGTVDADFSIQDLTIARTGPSSPYAINVVDDFVGDFTVNNVTINESGVDATDRGYITIGTAGVSGMTFVGNYTITNNTFSGARMPME